MTETLEGYSRGAKTKRCGCLPQAMLLAKAEIAGVNDYGSKGQLGYFET